MATVHCGSTAGAQAVAVGARGQGHGSRAAEGQGQAVEAGDSPGAGLEVAGRRGRAAEAAACPEAAEGAAEAQDAAARCPLKKSLRPSPLFPYGTPQEGHFESEGGNEGNSSVEIRNTLS